MEKFENRIYLASPTMHGEEQMYIKEAFDTNWVAPLGKNVNEFEKETAEYVERRDRIQHNITEHFAYLFKRYCHHLLRC